MNGLKQWYTSSAIWGSVVSIVALVLGVWGYSLGPDDQKIIVDGLAALGVFIGNLVAIHGRVTANKKIDTGK